MAAVNRLKPSVSAKILTELGGGQIVVIKVGTSSLLRTEQSSLNISNLAGLCETVRDLKLQGFHVIIVSSGAVGVGCLRLGLTSRPSALPQKQALAAVGQVHLMRYYDDLFSAVGVKCAQVLLTQDNLANRNSYSNAKATFVELLRYGAVPVVNENDTVAVEQLRFGDNDTLSAQVAALVEADWLFLLTDVPCLYSANPNLDPNAQPIHTVHDIAKLQVDTSSRGTEWGTGGMATKLTAARIATAAGSKMVICSANDSRNIQRVLDGECIGTVFHALPQLLRGRKRWILSVPLKGEVWLDDGAVRAVRDKKKSLFSAGVVKVVGDFAAHDALQLCTSQGVELGRGLANYAYDEVEKIKGKSSREAALLLGYQGSEEVVHRDNICLVSRQSLSTASRDGGGDRGDDDGDEHCDDQNGQDGGPQDGQADGSAVPSVAPASGLDADVLKRAAELRQRVELAGGTQEADVAYRLQMIASRGSTAAGEISTGQAQAQASWMERLHQAIEEENLAEAQMSGQAPSANAVDVNDEGWMPQ